MRQRELHDQGCIGQRRHRPGHCSQAFAQAKEHRHDHRQHACGKQRVAHRPKAKRQSYTSHTSRRAQGGTDQGDQPGDTGVGQDNAGLRHVGNVCCRIRGMFCLTLKNPVVAWGQIAVSQSRRHLQRVIPALAKTGAASSNQSRRRPWVM